MENLEKPQVISGAFAYNGQKNDIPDAPTGTAHASIQEGFPPITMIPQEDGGEAPYGQDFNGLGNLLSQFLFFYPERGYLHIRPSCGGSDRRLSGKRTFMVLSGRKQCHGQMVEVN